MKKYITIALCVLLLVVLALPTFAAEETKMTVTPSKTVVQRGETIDFTVSVTGETPYTSLFAELTIDTNVFEFVSSVTKANLMVDYDGTSIVVLNTAGTNYVGDLQVLTFRVKDTAPIKPSAVTGTASGNSGALTVQFVGTTVSINCEHDYPAAWTKIDDQYHEKVCSKCGTHDKQEHTWNEGEPIEPATCTDPGKEKFTCDDGCGATKEERIDPKGHAWDNDCDKVCNNDADHTRETSHKYGEKWATDTTSHWHECTICGDRKDNEDHKPGPEATDTSAQICTVCEYVIKPAKEHVHSYGDEWVYDTDTHWHRCKTKASPDCYVKDAEAPHDYDDACDVSCNTCDYVREAPHSFDMELKANAVGHWNVCTKCGERSQVEPHNPGAEATEDTPQTCLDCNFVIKMQLNHVHDFGEEWHNDDASHWQSCNDPKCPEVQTLEPHKWNEGEQQTDGNWKYVCTVCGKEVTQAEQMGTEPTTPPTTAPSGNEPTQPAAPQNPGEGEDDGGIPWKWAGIAAIALLIIGFILLIIEFIRSRKTNMHGKFSK